VATALIDTTTARGARAERRLREDLIAWLATVRPSGQPDLVPVWFLWDGESILIYSQPGKTKLRNIAHNPRVAMAVDNTHGGGDVVRIEGAAELVSGFPPANEVPDYVAKYAAQIQRIGYDPASFARAYSVPIRVTPTAIRY
jgi:PPOX class probable F420-dependent enzyme